MHPSTNYCEEGRVKQSLAHENVPTCTFWCTHGLGEVRRDAREASPHNRVSTQSSSCSCSDVKDATISDSGVLLAFLTFTELCSIVVELPCVPPTKSNQYSSYEPWYWRKFESWCPRMRITSPTGNSPLITNSCCPPCA